MRKKEIKLHMGFIEETEPLKLSKIPKKYQKLIEKIDSRWLNRYKNLYDLYYKDVEELKQQFTELIDQLLLTEKALNMAVEHISAFSDSCCYCDDNWKQKCPCGHAWWSQDCEKHIKQCLLKQAEEMMKSE